MGPVRTPATTAANSWSLRPTVDRDADRLPVPWAAERGSWALLTDSGPEPQVSVSLSLAMGLPDAGPARAGHGSAQPLSL